MQWLGTRISSAVSIALAAGMMQPASAEPLTQQNIEDTAYIYAHARCLKDAGATPQQITEYVAYESKAIIETLGMDLTTSKIEQAFDDPRLFPAIDEKYKRLTSIKSLDFCKKNIKAALVNSKDYIPLIRVSVIEQNLQCLRDRQASHGDVTQKHIEGFTQFELKTKGIDEREYLRLKSDVLHLPGMVERIKGNCSSVMFNIARSFDEGAKKASRISTQTDKPARSSISQTVNEVEPKASDQHEKCLNAKDYEGCMRYNAKGKGLKSEADKCDERLGICVVTTKGKDEYGLSKPVGWYYKRLDDGRILYFSKAYRVPHKGQESRYIGFKRITRYYQSPERGSSGVVIGGSSSSTNCFESGSSLSCTTSGSPSTYIPGRSALPGGVQSIYFYEVYVCKDMTGAAYKEGKLFGGGWSKTPKTEPSQILEATCKLGKEHRERFEPLYVKM